MLHNINLPRCEAQLREVLDFQEAVLRFACTPPVDLSLEGLKQALGEEAGAWFWDRLYYQQRETRLFQYFRNLLDYLDQHPQARQHILNSFVNDKQFPDHIDDENYRFYQRIFSQNTIEADELNAIKPLMVAFYETLLESTGFPQQIHPNTGTDKLTRSDWNEAFWNDNPRLRVCPACDSQRPDRVRGRISSQVNHFLPKEIYPFYSIHPDNLVPVCATCNTIAQGSRDPIDDHQNAPLVNCFHPYYRPAIDHICVTASVSDVGTLQVYIREREGSLSRRVLQLIEVLDLEGRWGGRIEALVNNLIESLAPDSEDELREKLSERFIDTKDYIRREANSYVYHQILSYFLDNSAELSILWQVFDKNETS